MFSFWQNLTTAARFLSSYNSLEYFFLKTFCSEKESGKSQ